MIGKGLGFGGLLQRPHIVVRTASVEDAAMIAAIHGEAFARGWSDGEIEALMRQDNVFALVAEYRNAFGHRSAAGFVLVRSAADEAEILTIAVNKANRRRGVGGALMDETIRRLYAERIGSLFLEVDSGNVAAIALYEALEFVAVGERSGYYARGSTPARGALV
ncbi:MAG TPA: GNAT family N-acetyltransferase, partial [Afifellaceae bacterium]|nr:GNAT family N-acetyltransferase [Afifellaceae bacterium]